MTRMFKNDVSECPVLFSGRRFICNGAPGRTVTVIVILILSGMNTAFAQTKDDTMAFHRPRHIADAGVDLPNWQTRLHDVGNVSSWVRNSGFITNPFEYPKGSNIYHIFVAEYWIGGIVGRDTLVSTAFSGRDGTTIMGSEFNPVSGEAGAIVYRSLLSDSPGRHRDALSEQDYICEFADTLTDPAIIGEDQSENRPHKPLYISVHQESYAWSFDYADDFILFDCCVRNIGAHDIENMFIGLFVNPGIYHPADPDFYSWSDDLIGFKDTIPLMLDGCREYDSVMVFWAASSDGAPGPDRNWDIYSREDRQFQLVGRFVNRPQV